MIGLTITSCVVLVLALILLLNYLYLRTSRYKNECIDIKTYFNGVPENLKFVNLGSTYSKFAFGGIDELKLESADLSLQAQSLDADYSLLKEYSCCFSDGCIVFICLAACCMMYEGNNNPLYCKILNKENNPKYSLKEKLKSVFPLLINPRRVKYLIKHDEEYQNIYDSMRQANNDCEAESILNNMANGWIKMFNLSNLKEAQISDYNQLVIKKNTEILKSMIDYCIDHGYRPVVVVPPFSSKMNSYFSREFTEKVIDQNVVTACGDIQIPFLNYQWDDEFSERYDLFKDQGFRLNVPGSIAFIRRLAKDLRQYNIILNNKTCGR